MNKRGEWSCRPATSDDHPHYARLFPELMVDDPIPSRERWDQDLMHRSLFLWAGDRPVAYGLWAVFDKVGNVQNVIVDPAYRRRGVGAALMQEIAARLLREGCSQWYLYVKVDNMDAIRLYERCGLVGMHVSTPYVFNWGCLERLPREPTEVAAFPIEPAEDAALEAAFHQPSGRLAQLRKMPERVMLRLVDQAHPDDKRVGITAFDPTFPGASLFAVARTTLAAPLLSAIRPHAPADQPAIKLMIDDDAQLNAELRASGAIMRFELLHMRGEIPRVPLR